MVGDCTDVMHMMEGLITSLASLVASIVCVLPASVVCVASCSSRLVGMALVRPNI